MSQYVPYVYVDPRRPANAARQPPGPVQAGWQVQGTPGGGPVVANAGAAGSQPQQPAQSPPAQGYQGQGTVPGTPAPQAPQAGIPAPQPQPPGPAQAGAAPASSPPPTAGPVGTVGPAPSGPVTGGPPQSLGADQSPSEPVAVPLIDVLESPDEFVVVADLPGFEEEDITVQADDTTLVLRASREDDPGEEYQVRQAERPRRLERYVPLPPNGDVDGATATQDNGVCTVTIPVDGPEQRVIGFH